MKKVLIPLALVAVLCLPAAALGWQCDYNNDFSINTNGWNIGDLRIKVDDDVVKVRHVDRSRVKVVINEDYELSIRGKDIALDDNQRETVKEFYDLAIESDKCVREIAWEGARIGIEGAKIGVKAVGGVLKVIFTDYDEDEFEEYIDREGEKLDARGEELEEKAEKLEEMVNELEELYYDMEDQIPELKQARRSNDPDGL
jgi:hypothetical protein